MAAGKSLSTNASTAPTQEAAGSVAIRNQGVAPSQMENVTESKFAMVSRVIAGAFGKTPQQSVRPGPQEVEDQAAARALVEEMCSSAPLNSAATAKRYAWTTQPDYVEPVYTGVCPLSTPTHEAGVLSAPLNAASTVDISRVRAVNEVLWDTVKLTQKTDRNTTPGAVALAAAASNAAAESRAAASRPLTTGADVARLIRVERQQDREAAAQPRSFQTALSWETNHFGAALVGFGAEESNFYFGLPNADGTASPREKAAARVRSSSAQRHSAENAPLNAAATSSASYWPSQRRQSWAAGTDKPAPRTLVFELDAKQRRSRALKKAGRFAESKKLGGESDGAFAYFFFTCSRSFANISNLVCRSPVNSALLTDYCRSGREF